MSKTIQYLILSVTILLLGLSIYQTIITPSFFFMSSLCLCLVLLVSFYFLWLRIKSFNIDWIYLNGYKNAIDKSIAVIEFDLDGNILVANDLFLETMGYSLREIQGKHHRMFCNNQYVNTVEYKQF